MYYLALTPIPLARVRPNVVRREGGVGVNANYLPHASDSVVSSGLAIRFTDAFVISRKRATDPPRVS